MSRRLVPHSKKPRGVARRLRAIRRWPDEVATGFPPDHELQSGDQYWNWKIPVDLNLVESRWTTDEIRKVCAQSLIDACDRLAAAKPTLANDYRVTCVLCIPDIFTSELCIYLSEDYFLSHASSSSNEYGQTTLIEGRSISDDWGLILPEGFSEVGFTVDYHDPESDWHLVGERWYFGEVAHEANRSFKPNPLRETA